MAQGTPSGNGAVTSTLASTPSAAVIAVSRYSGVAANPIGNVVSNNTGGVFWLGCSGLQQPTNTYSVNLTTTTNGAVIYGAVAMKAATHTAGAGYTERVEIKQKNLNSGLTASAAVEDMTVAAAGTVPVNGSFNSTVDWAVVAVEIKPQAAISKLSVTAENKSAENLFPAGYQLEQNYPNPFSGSGISGRSNTLIAFSLPAASQVSVSIYSITGQLVREIVNGEMAAGRHAISWDGRNQVSEVVAAGTYLYRLVVLGSNGEVVFSKTQRMTMVK